MGENSVAFGDACDEIDEIIDKIIDEII